MNLYIFSETRRGAVYGIGTYIRELTDALKKTDINIYVIHLMSETPYIQQEETDGVNQWYFPAPVLEQRSIDSREYRILYQRNVVYLLQLYIKNREGLIFHLNFPQSESLAEALKGVFDCKVVSVVHFSEWGFTVFDNPQRLRNILREENSNDFGENVKKTFEEEKSYYSKVDHCICLSNYMQEILCEDYEIHPAKISIIPNGLSDAAETSTNIDLLKQKWNILSGEKIILFAGRLDEIKGLSYLIKAFKHVLSVSPQSRLVIAGAGDFSKYTKESQDICTKISYTGLLDKPQLYEWYRMADVGVVPSLFEPFGLVAVEMMMHRLPMVVTATSGMNEVVDDSSALKVPLIVCSDHVEIDTSLLTRQIVYLLQHPAEAKRLGKNARKRYLAIYTSCIFGENMTTLYKSLYDE